ncbi:MAG: DUF1830 domain-containing protein [Nostocaceae cyanobacterium]|nr:DUF1830 domain-containing protein [Nostocaceae cyanobacterium]
MAQILDPIPAEQSTKILCCYVNATSKIQVARISNIPNWYFERVVFPGQRLVFESPPEGYLEIHTGMMASAILSDTIPCDRLAIKEQSSDPLETDSKSGEQDFNNNSVGQSIKTKTVDTTKPLTTVGCGLVD